MKPDTHIVVRRVTEKSGGSYKYIPHETAEYLEAAQELASQNYCGAECGDVVIVVDMLNVASISDEAEAVYYIDKNRKAHHIDEGEIMKCWDGVDADADTMMRLASKFSPIKDVSLAAIACARTFIPEIKNKKHAAVSKKALDTAEDYWLGRHTLERAKRAKNSLYKLAEDMYFDPCIVSYFSPIACAVSSVHDKTENSVAYTPVRIAARRNATDKETLSELSVLVREAIPLFKLYEHIHTGNKNIFDRNIYSR